MLEQDYELAVGDVRRVGDCLVVVVDVEDDVVTFRIEDLPSQELVAETSEWVGYPR